MEGAVKAAKDVVLQVRTVRRGTGRSSCRLRGRLKMLAVLVRTLPRFDVVGRLLLARRVRRGAIPPRSSPLASHSRPGYRLPGDVDDVRCWLAAIVKE